MNSIQPKHIFLLLCAAILWGGSASVAIAQSRQPVVVANFSKDTILIGDQINLRVTVQKDLMQETDFPVFHNGLGGKIEILQESPIDTLKKEGREITLRRDYLITCFEAGNYKMSGFPILYTDKNTLDTIFSPDSLQLWVNTFEIDTTKQTIADIKPPIDAPLQFREISDYVFGGALLLLLIAALIYYIRKRMRNKSIRESEKPILPPHIEAMNELEKAYMLKLWKEGKEKQYYTALTDIVRNYIERRFGINAPEMTSDEILAHFSKGEISGKGFEYLRSLITIADLVKFAKLVPFETEHQQAYTDAYGFVTETQPIVVELQEELKKKQTLVEEHKKEKQA